MIDYPEDAQLHEQIAIHDLPGPVLIRDIVRVVEVLNLNAKQFFNKRSVLSGSMALRCFGSPRFTVYDADFSTTAATVDPPDSITPLLRYSDENLDIIPLGAEPSDQRKSLITVEPIRFDAAFTAIALTEQEQQFKADVSFRGLLLDGRQVPFTTPYTLRLWQEAPAVWVMDPLETLAEKILGWCVHGTVKHYADIGWITLAAQQPGSPLVFTHFKLREVLDEKLRSLQPALYEPYPSVEAIVGKLAQPPQLDRGQWQKLVYLQGQRTTYSETELARIVQHTLAPGLRGAQLR